jgi:hypothetical protein
MGVKIDDDFTGGNGQASPTPPEAPDHLDRFWESRPVLRHIRDFARARLVGPWALLGCLLVRVIAATTPKIVLPPITGGPASLNLFVGVVSRSGGGKGTAEAASLDAIKLPHVPVLGPGSGEGIGHLFYAWDKRDQELKQHTEAVIISAAEINTLTALKLRQASTLFPELHKVWMGEPLGFSYVASEKRLNIPRHGYRLGLITGIQPANAGTILDGVDDGTPQRWLWMPSDDPGAPDERPAEPEPWDTWMKPASFLQQPMRVCVTARAEVEGARLAQLRREPVEALDGHALLSQLKVAAALAILDNRSAEITEEDWRLAGVVRGVSDRTRQEVAAELDRKARAKDTARALSEGRRDVIRGRVIADDELQRACQAITRKLGRVRGEWVPGNVARSAVASSLRHHFDDAVERLEETGQVETESFEYNGRPGIRLRLTEAAR